MLAFLFWHRPYPEVEPAAYEEALTSFYTALAETTCPGFQGAATYRISETPWLGDRKGYEDWTLLDGSWAMDPLNEAAVSPAMWDTHAAIAEKADFGHGGLYQHLQGDIDPTRLPRVWWLKRPRGIRYEKPLKAIAGSVEGPVSVWRKQMVLGPAPEFALAALSRGKPALPEGWQAFAVEREALHATPPE